MKTFEEFKQDVLNPYLKDKGIEVGNTISTTLSVKFDNEADFRRLALSDEEKNILSHCIKINYFVRDVEIDSAEKKYNNGFDETVELVELTGSVLYCQEEMTIGLSSIIVDERLFDIYDRLNTDTNTASTDAVTLLNGVLNTLVELYNYNMAIPYRDSKSCLDLSFSSIDKVYKISHIDEEYITDLIDKDSDYNTFRYNLDYLDIQQWALKRGMDVFKYRIIDESPNTFKSRMSKRNNDIFEHIQIEHYKPLVPGQTYPNVYSGEVRHGKRTLGMSVDLIVQ